MVSRGHERKEEEGGQEGELSSDQQRLGVWLRRYTDGLASLLLLASAPARSLSLPLSRCLLLLLQTLVLVFPMFPSQRVAVPNVR